MLHSGIDNHKANCFITTVNDCGDVVKDAWVRNTVDAVSAYLRFFVTDPTGPLWSLLQAGTS
jgi:hypothetical protein